MKVKTVDGRETDGVRLLVAVVEHAEAPPSGTWAFSAERAALVDPAGAVWMLADDGPGVTRVVLLPCACECAEVTTYREGVEVSRSVGPTS